MCYFAYTYKLLVLTCFFVALSEGFGKSLPCAARKYDGGSVVCVCNASYCDTIYTTLPEGSVPAHSVRVFQSTKSGQRFNFKVTQLHNSGFQNYKDSSVTITLNPYKTFQTIKGFGGAITDAAAINIKSLKNSAAEDHLINSYYGVAGIEYNLGRVPIASCDYSIREYTYLDTEDNFNLSTFALAIEDIAYKIPVLHAIFSASHKPVSLYASPWTAPAWMKTNNNEIGISWLKGKPGDKYHKTWAQYFVRFFEEYSKLGIKFWGVTVQNEPSNGLIVPSFWQSTGFTSQMERDFVKLDLGPALQGSAITKDLKVMILDDQRVFLPTWVENVLSDPDAAKYVSGIGVHWYQNRFAGPALLTDTHYKFPDTFILATEACNKWKPDRHHLGNWTEGVLYSSDIIDNLNHWAVGWVDWNMALNLDGGPNWAHNYDNSPIIVNSTAGEFYKQPMYYHLGHFSKFLPEGSVIIHSETNIASSLKFISAITPSKEKVLVILNRSSKDVPITVLDSPHHFNYTVPGDAILTFLWDF